MSCLSSVGFLGIVWLFLTTISEIYQGFSSGGILGICRRAPGLPHSTRTEFSLCSRFFERQYTGTCAVAYEGSGGELSATNWVSDKTRSDRIGSWSENSKRGSQKAINTSTEAVTLLLKQQQNYIDEAFAFNPCLCSSYGFTYPAQNVINQKGTNEGNPPRQWSIRLNAVHSLIPAVGKANAKARSRSRWPSTLHPDGFCCVTFRKGVALWWFDKANWLAVCSMVLGGGGHVLQVLQKGFMFSKPSDGVMSYPQYLCTASCFLFCLQVLCSSSWSPYSRISGMAWVGWDSGNEVGVGWRGSAYITRGHFFSSAVGGSAWVCRCPLLTYCMGRDDTKINNKGHSASVKFKLPPVIYWCCTLTGSHPEFPGSATTSTTST